MTESDSRQRHVRPHARGLVVYPRPREKLARDRVFLLASALSFNILITFIPVALLLVAALGVVIEASSEAEQAFRTIVQRAARQGLAKYLMIQSYVETNQCGSKLAI